MDDTISRAAALDALGEEPPVWCDGEDEIAERDQWRRDVAAIKALPSAQPTGTNTVQVEDCISRAAVLDEIHKYMEERDYTIGTLYDNICEMPSAQSVNIAKLQPNCNQVASDCASHCASDCISRQAAISEIMEDIEDRSLHDDPATPEDYAEGYDEGIRNAAAIVLQMPPAQPGWIPVTERLPEYGTTVLTCDHDGEYEINHIIDEEDGEWFWDGAVAWIPITKPWEGEKP